MKSAINLVELEKSYRYLLEALADITAAGGPPFAEVTGDLKEFIKSANLIAPETIKCHAFNMANAVGEVATRVEKGAMEIRAEAPAAPTAPAAVVAAKTQLLNGEPLTLLTSVINHLISIRPQQYEREAGAIIKLINSGSPIEATLQRLLYLVLQMREDLWAERAKAFKRIVEALKSLENTEKVFISSLNTSHTDLAGTEGNFTQCVESGLKEIGTLIKPGQVDLETLCRQVAERVANLHQCVERKKQADQARFAVLTAERENAEQRLAKTRRDYEDFSKQSHAMLKEIKTLKAVSLRDPLTDIYNRRAYDSQIVKTVEAFRAGELKTCCLVVFDIDHFREFKNAYGHLAGDKVLAYVARLTRESLRTDDLVFRYGGDEFVIIVPNVSLAAGLAVAEKVRGNVTAVEFKLFKNSDVTAKVTVSIGVAEIRPEDDPASFFKNADQALYQAKSAGRNQVNSA